MEGNWIPFVTGGALLHLASSLSKTACLAPENPTGFAFGQNFNNQPNLSISSFLYCCGYQELASYWPLGPGNLTNAQLNNVGPLPVRKSFDRQSTSAQGDAFSEDLLFLLPLKSPFRTHFNLFSLVVPAQQSRDERRRVEEATLI